MHREGQSNSASLARTRVLGSAAAWREQAHGPWNAIPACCSPRHEGCQDKTLLAQGLRGVQGKKGTAGQGQTPALFGDPYQRGFSPPPQQWALPSTFSRRRVTAPRKAHWVRGERLLLQQGQKLTSRPRASCLSSLPVAPTSTVPFHPTAPSVPALLGAAERNLPLGTVPCRSHGMRKEGDAVRVQSWGAGICFPTRGWPTSPQLAQVCPEAGPPFQRGGL